MGQSLSQAGQSNNDMNDDSPMTPVNPDSTRDRDAPTQRWVLRSTTRALRSTVGANQQYQRPAHRQRATMESNPTTNQRRVRVQRRAANQAAEPMNTDEAAPSNAPRTTLGQDVFASVRNETSFSRSGNPLHSAMPSLSPPANNVHSNNSSSSPMSVPTMRMITEIIAEAVMTTFREHSQYLEPRSAHQHTTMELDSEWMNSTRQDGSLFGAAEAFSNTSFARCIHIPVIITTHNTRSRADQTAQQATDNHDTTPQDNGHQRVQRSTIPVLILGRRTPSDEPMAFDHVLPRRPTVVDQFGRVASEHPMRSDESAHHRDQEAVETPPLRRSIRIQHQQERLARQRGLDENVSYGRWVIYILSVPNEGGIPSHLLSDTASYEELLALTNLLGPVRPPTTTLDNINMHIPVQVFSADVMNDMVGNKDRCSVCLESFASLEALRVLNCKHGFHKSCIDKWLTEEQNRCPLCRDTAVPETAASRQ